MQPLQPSGSQQQQAPIPLRWTEAIAALEEAQGTLDALGKQIEGAIYLDEETWTQAVPHAQFTAALHVGSLSSHESSLQDSSANLWG